MFSKVMDWLGFGSGEFERKAGGHGHGHESGEHGHKHGVVDPSIATTAKGIWAIKWSFVILALTSLFQLFVVFASGSIALLADTIHNVADATTAIPLWVAFVLVRRPATKVFNYGLGRVEDLAGILIVLIILASALFAGYEAINRLFNPQPVTLLGWVAAAGIIGFLGNEIVAVFRIRVGREIESAALIADGYHARTDGLTSLAVVAGAIGVWAGFPLADPVIGLLITITIFGIVWQSAKTVLTRALDGIDPAILDEIRHAAEHVPGLKVMDARARWIGHRLHADVAVAIDEKLPVGGANRLTDLLRGELLGHISALRTVTVTLAGPNDANVMDIMPHAHGHDHSSHHSAPEPFLVKGALAEGELAIVDTPDGERFRLTLTKPRPTLKATVVINRPGGPETLPLLALAEDKAIFESAAAPAEPHTFSAELRLSTKTKNENLPFKIEEPKGHGH